jgi:hypothetical protein
LFFQPSIYSREKNSTNEEIFFDESQKVTGLVVGLFGLITSSILPVLTTSFTTDAIGAILIWQAIGACATSTTG